ncbi:MAG: hypothetical protein ACTHJQ_19085 [Rhizobiaceae bacterium]|jgi:hypothetical protein
MPFRAIENDRALRSDDLDFLQEVYEAAAANASSIDDAAMHDVVKTLIMYYRAGERDKGRLTAVAAWDLRRAAG